MKAMTTPTATITKPKMKIPPKLITIERVEGTAAQCYESVHDTWERAEERIRDICLSMDKGRPGYDKTKFRIEFVDGEIYEGRFDATHPEHPHFEGTLERHIREHLTFLAGLWCPPHLTEDKYHAFLAETEQRSPGTKQEALDFLRKYALNDSEADPSLLPTRPGSSPAPTTTGNAPMQTATPPPQKSAREAHEENVAIGKASGQPWLLVVGNTFPIRGVLYAFGGKWDGKAKQWSVPSHKHAEAQAAADKFTRPTKAATPAPIIIPPGLPMKSIPPGFVQPPNPVQPANAPMTPQQAVNRGAQVAGVPTPPARIPTPKPAKAPRGSSPLERRLQALLTGAKAIHDSLPVGDPVRTEMTWVIGHAQGAIDSLRK